MAVVLRSDLSDMDRAKITTGVAWTVLGMFKKLWRQRSPALRAWDTTGRSIIVLGASSEEALLHAQAAARRISLATHTFAGVSAQKKERSVMVVGPAEESVLLQALQGLQRL